MYSIYFIKNNLGEGEHEHDDDVSTLRNQQRLIYLTNDKLFCRSSQDARDRRCRRLNLNRFCSFLTPTTCFLCRGRHTITTTHQKSWFAWSAISCRRWPVGCVNELICEIEQTTRVFQSRARKTAWKLVHMLSVNVDFESCVIIFVARCVAHLGFSLQTNWPLRLLLDSVLICEFR